MFKQFATGSPRAAIALIYVAGYLAGSLLGALFDYLISGVVKVSATLAFGTGFGTMAIALAQHWDLIPTPEELNKPLSLFGPGGYHGEDRK